MDESMEQITQSIHPSIIHPSIKFGCLHYRFCFTQNNFCVPISISRPLFFLECQAGNVAQQLGSIRSSNVKCISHTWFVVQPETGLFNACRRVRREAKSLQTGETDLSFPLSLGLRLLPTSAVSQSPNRQPTAEQAVLLRSTHT
ncbi:hypothetical protein AMECASPLE_031113 [Ameca splendens]|uniref:Uncharacterized protein n=1 Tax=Ameca splendens TaxID=208324 RepID=A0ABV0Y641_9TELE